MESPSPEAERGGDGAAPPLPLLVRIGGLPVSAVESVGSSACAEALARLADAEEARAAARAAFVDILFAAIGSAPPDLRRFLLAVKRDVHNGRPLDGRRRDARWSAVRRDAGERLGALESAETAATDAAASFAAIHSDELARGLGALRRLADRPGFRRALDLASPALAEGLRRFEAPGALDRRRRRTAETLLRYASRAALKLSPFSTLTRVALADAGGTRVTLVGHCERWRERSEVRLRRYLPQQIGDLLLRHHAGFLATRPLVLNPTLAPAGTGRFRLLRPAGWQLPPEGEGERAPRHRPPTLREVPVEPALVDWLATAAGAGGASFDELASRLPQAGGGARDLLRKLVELDLLVPVPPWSASEPRLEAALAAALGAGEASLGAGADGLARLGRSLAEVVELEDGLATSPEPAGDLRRIEKAFAASWDALVAELGLQGEIVPRRVKESEVFEDVILEHVPAEEGDGGGPCPGAIGRVPARAMRQACAAAAPWYRLACLLSPRREILLTLDRALENEWPDGRPVPVLDAFAALAGLWRQIRRAPAARWQSPPDAAEPFDPLEVEEIGRLHAARRRVWAALAELVAAAPATSRREGGAPAAEIALAPEALAALLDRLDPELPPDEGPCLFLQPADTEAERWVLNRMFEGTGRYASRYLPLLAPPGRDRFLAALVAGGSPPPEMLDLFWTRGDTLNVHLPQTPRVLRLPGERLDLPAERCVGIEQLLIVRRAGALPALSAGDGEELVAVHLGGASAAYLPPLLQFVAAFGPGERLPPPRLPRPAGGGDSRLVLGPLVVERHRRSFLVAELRAELAQASDAASRHRVLDGWRRANRLPARFFVLEGVRHPSGGRAFKPQYLDLSSPLFAELLAGVVGAAGERLVVEEMLPTSFPADESGARWAVELLVDTLPLRAACGGRRESGDPHAVRGRR